MAQQENQNDDEGPGADQPAADGGPSEIVGGTEDEQLSAPMQLGTTRYVHVAFFAAGLFVAFLAGKLLLMLWDTLAEVPAITRTASWLLRFREDERATATMLVGALIGILAVVAIYRKEAVRTWADEVAAELAKVHWPNKEQVQNGTIVVIVAGLFATLYVGLLDRLWIFVTTLVYGA